MVNGTVVSYLQRNPSVGRLKLISQVASGICFLVAELKTTQSFSKGLEYLHLSGVIHGDLRGVNI